MLHSLCNRATNHHSVVADILLAQHPRNCSQLRHIHVRGAANGARNVTATRSAERKTLWPNIMLTKPVQQRNEMQQQEKKKKHIHTCSIMRLPSIKPPIVVASCVCIRRGGSPVLIPTHKQIRVAVHLMHTQNHVGDVQSRNVSVEIMLALASFFWYGGDGGGKVRTRTFRIRSRHDGSVDRTNGEVIRLVRV